ncbi:TrbC/VirB2 family protein [Candidatus Peregrinibacteria bacterium]|nr:TrbC/VirB2 family protein [Candidatus Peregrinibacteria bacterium]
MIHSLQNFSFRASFAAYTFFAATKAFAQDLFGEVPAIEGIDATDEDSARSAILDILFLVLRFMALVAVIIIVIAGIRLVISQGEETEKDKAKKAIFYAIIGLVIILLAQAIVSIVAGLPDQ